MIHLNACKTAFLSVYNQLNEYSGIYIFLTYNHHTGTFNNNLESLNRLTTASTDTVPFIPVSIVKNFEKVLKKYREITKHKRIIQNLKESYKKCMQHGFP